VPIEPHGWANVMASEAVIRRRLGEQVGTATAEEMGAVEVAIAAMYGLPR
jgi:mRNA-degrading endonuclease toxin of MazEF toxin-antitoxin module